MDLAADFAVAILTSALVERAALAIASTIIFDWFPTKGVCPSTIICGV
jgi:hypothetical protein